MEIKIRTITLQNFLEEKDEALFQNFSKNLSIFKDNGLAPRTYRVVANPISVNNVKVEGELKAYVDLAEQYGFWGVGLPFDVAGDNYEEIIALADSLRSRESVFLNFLPIKGGVFNLKALVGVSGFILRGADEPVCNFRVGVSSQQITTPFFPFACANTHGAFTVGLELVGFITELVQQNNRMTLSQLRNVIVESVAKRLQEIEQVCLQFEKQSGTRYAGLDLSLAPYPYPLEDQSIAALLEEIGKIARSRGETVFEFGAQGTHFLNSFLTDILKTLERDAGVRTTGFNGVMYSLLEDTILSKRYEGKTYDIHFLKLLATTCGCGIDMVPLSGAVKQSALFGLILDVLSTGIILEKPLGVRVLPVSSLSDGEKTTFKHLFFANTRVREIDEGMTVQYLPSQDAEFSFNIQRYG